MVRSTFSSSVAIWAPLKSTSFTLILTSLAAVSAAASFRFARLRSSTLSSPFAPTVRTFVFVPRFMLAFVASFADIVLSSPPFTDISFALSAVRVAILFVSIVTFSLVSVSNFMSPGDVMLRLSRPLFSLLKAGAVGAFIVTSDLISKFSMLVTPLIALSRSPRSSSDCAPFFSTVTFSVSLPPKPSRVSREDKVEVLSPSPE